MRVARILFILLCTITFTVSAQDTNDKVVRPVSDTDEITNTKVVRPIGGDEEEDGDGSGDPVVYPQPASIGVTIKLGKAGITRVVSVMDYTNQIVIGPLSTTSSSISIDVSNLQSGSYIVSILSDSKLRKKRLNIKR